MRRLSWSLFGLLILAVLIGLCLPRRSEVRRSAVLPASPAVIHGLLSALPRGPAWCTWEPALRPAGPTAIVATASLESQGVWFDVPSPRGVRKAALLLSPVPAPVPSGLPGGLPGGGTRIEWFDVLHLRLNPLASLWSLTRERRIGPQLEESLEALRQQLTD